MSTQKYVALWKKYLPAVVKFMVDAADKPQTYKFLNHEFRDMNPKQAGGYTFKMRVHKRRIIDRTGDSPVAADLLTILSHSGKAAELTEDFVYEFELDKEFILNIKREDLPETEKVEEEVPTDEVENTSEKDTKEPPVTDKPE